MKNVKESLIELVMGDAILELLEAESPISHEALIKQLSQALAFETRESRREAILAAINEIHESTRLIVSQSKKGILRHGREGRPLDVGSLNFHHSASGSGDKKH